MYIIKETHPIARKEHTCMLCGCTINVGERYVRQTIFDGCEIYDATCHEDCVGLAYKLDIDDDGDGISQDDFQAAIDDYLSEAGVTNKEVEISGLSYIELVRMIMHQK